MLKYLGVLFVIIFQPSLAYSYEVFYCTDKEACQGKKVIYHEDFIDAIKGVYGIHNVYDEPFRDDAEDTTEAPDWWTYDMIPKENHIRVKFYGGISYSIALRIYEKGGYSY